MKDITDFIKLASQDVVANHTKDQFHRKGKKLLQLIAKALAHEQVTIRNQKGGPAVSGEIILHTDKVYIMIGQLFGKAHVMVRRVNGPKDFTGGTNHHMALQCLQDFTSFIERVKEIAAPLFQVV